MGALFRVSAMTTFIHFSSLSDLQAYAAAEFDRSGSAVCEIVLSVKIANSDLLQVRVTKALEVFAA